VKSISDCTWLEDLSTDLSSRHLRTYEAKRIDEHLHRSRLARSDWAGRPRPFLGRFGPVFFPDCFSHDSLFVCTCMWAFDVVSFTVKA
jgi:hypothetical protein